MPKFKIPVVWTMVGYSYVDDPSVTTLEEAKNYVLEHDEIGLPDDQDYLEGSFEIDEATLNEYEESDWREGD